MAFSTGRPRHDKYRDDRENLEEIIGDIETELNSGTGTGDVVGPSSATDGNVALYDGTTGKLLKDSAHTDAELTELTGGGVTALHTHTGGSGDVVGPSGATVNAAAIYDGATGKLIRNSLVVIDQTTGVMDVPALGTGAPTAYDITIGNSLDYGIARIGNAVFGRTNYNTGSLDLRGAVILWNQGGPVAGQIEFAIAESTTAIRFAIPKSGVGNATYNPRSMLLAGPAPADDDMVTVGYWQGLGIFDNLACDTGTDGADLGVQNDLEVEGDIFADSIKESTTAAGVTIDGVLVKDGEVDGRDVDADGTAQDAHIAAANPHSGSIGGALGTTDNALLRANGVGGLTAQGSVASLSDLGALTLAGAVNITGGGLSAPLGNVSCVNVSPTGTVDGRDVATDGTAQDAHIADDGLHTTSGTSFPGSPVAGQLFYRTDLNYQFYYDATRAKWLGTSEINIMFGRNGTNGAGYLRLINGMVCSATKGYYTRWPATVVGWSYSQLTLVAGYYRAYLGGVYQTGAQINHATTVLSNDVQNVDIAQGILAVYNSSGTVSSPQVMITIRRHAT